MILKHFAIETTKHMKVVFKIFRLCGQLSFITWGCMGSEKLQKRISDGCSNNLPEKWTLSSKESRTATDTAMSPDWNTIRNEDLQQLSTEKCFRFCFSTVTIYFPLDETWVKIFYRRPRVFLEFCCLIWLPVATCQLALEMCLVQTEMYR